MQKEDLPYDISWRDSFHIWSSQTCGFTSWSSSPRENYNTREHWWSPWTPTETKSVRIFICEIRQENNINLILAPILIKSLPDGTKVLRSLIDSRIKEGDCSNSWKFFARHCAKGISQIKVIDFDESYSTVTNSDPSRINIAVADTARILDVSNDF